MKKNLLWLFLVLTTFYAQSAFVPDPSALYNIKQTNSGLVIGGLETSPCLQTVNQKTIQAFSFEPVPDMTDTYYLKNADGLYLSKLSGNSGDWWSVVYETAPNGANSQWVIEGEQTAFRLKLMANSLYLASDQTTNGSGIYCDKTADNVNGVFALEVAEVIFSVFEISEKAMVPQVEIGGLSYPIHIKMTGVSDTVFAVAPTGFAIEPNFFAPADMAALSGKTIMKVTTSAAAGTDGQIFFYIGAIGPDYLFDTLSVKAVEKQERFFIINASDTTKVVGNHSTASAPALNINTGDKSQQFIFRPVHAGVNDSLFYFIQDETYRAISKDPTSNWEVLFSVPAEEAVWKVVPEPNGKTCSIYNTVTGLALGTDGLGEDSRLYDDKTFTPEPTAKPYCEWIIVNVASTIVPELFSLSDNNAVLEVEKDNNSYPIEMTTSGIKETINVTATAGFSLSKSAFTPEEIKASGGKAKVRVSTSATPGTTGFVYFSRSSGNLDTVSVVSIEKALRYTIANRSAPGLSIGNHLTAKAPALTESKDTITQKFILRPVNPTLNDSMYYILQDGDYLMMQKSADNDWDVIFGGWSEEAKWYVRQQEGGACSISSVVGGKDLGTDGITSDSRLYCDKVFMLNPISAPYCEWIITAVGNAVKKSHEQPLTILTSKGRVSVAGTTVGKLLTVYNLFGQVVRSLRTEDGRTTFDLPSGAYLVRIGNQTLKVIN